MASNPIHSVQSVSGNQPRIRRIGELATQTFLSGTPVMLDPATGYVKAWDGVTITNGLAGFSLDFGANLTTNNVAQQPSVGSVPNETSAAVYTRPYANDGRSGFETSTQDTVFLGQINPTGQTLTQANVGQKYGLTKDSDGHWYVDLTKNTVGTNTMVQIVKLDPNDQSATPRGVYFIVLPGSAQLVA